MTSPTQSTDPFEVIDMRDAIDAVRQKYPGRSVLDPEAQWEVAAHWGVTPEMDSISEHGGFTDIQERTCFTEGGCRAEIRLARASDYFWAMGTSCSSRTSGYGYIPSVWNLIAYPSREDAWLAGLYEVIHFFNNEADSQNSGSSEANRRDARKMVAQLEAAKTPQLSLGAV